MTDLSVPDPLGAVPRLEALRAALATRARDVGRAPEEVTLIAVSKTYSADEVWPTLALGKQRVFGENRVQEAQAKWSALRERFPAVELHLVGQLQSNKADEAVALFVEACAGATTPRRPQREPSTDAAIADR